MLWLTVHLVLALIAGLMCSGKGYGFWYGFAISFLAPLIGFIIIYRLPDRSAYLPGRWEAGDDQLPGAPGLHR